MKRIILFLMAIGVLIGIIIGVRTNDQHKLPKDTDVDVVKIENSIKELNLSLSDIDTLNPLRTQNSHIAATLNLIYEPLFTYDLDNQIEPCLAVEWASQNNLSWIVKLRENVKWHGGQDFTGNDVKYTIELLKEDTVGSIYKDNVKNVETVELIDPYTILITLQKEDPYFFSKLTFPIIPKYYFNGNGIFDEEKANRPVGTGAFMYDSLDDNAIHLIANHEWWKEPAFSLQKIHLLKYATYGEAIKGFKSSEVDMIYTNMHEWKEKFGFIGINSYQFESNEFELLIPNCANTLMNNSLLRQAIRLAINREEIVTNVYDGNASIKDIPIHSSSRYVLNTTGYNPETAKQLLLKAGFENYSGGWKKNNKKLTLNLIVLESNEDQIKVAEKLKQNLEEISIPITIKKQKWAEFEKNMSSGKFDIAIASIQVKNQYLIQELLQTNHINNYANYSNEEIDTLINELKVSANSVYETKLKELIQIYQEDVPYIGLYFKNGVILTNKSVKGQYECTEDNPYRNIINFSK